MILNLLVIIKAESKPAMTDITQALKTLAQKIYNRSPLSTSQLFGEIELKNSQIISLLLLMRNQTISNRVQASQLLVFEQITATVSSFVKFDSGQASLAKFDRSGFKRECRKISSKYVSFLLNSVDGIYPQRNIEKYPYSQSIILAYDRQHLLDGNQVGNLHWQRTRDILHQFYENEASQKQKMYLQILLSYKNQLLFSFRAKDPLYRIWLLLYTTTISIFLDEKQLNNSDIAQLLSQVQKIQQQVSNKRQNIVISLIHYSIERELCVSEQPNEFLNICKTCLQELNLEQNLLENAMIVILLEDCLNFLQQQPTALQVSEELRSMKDYITKEILNDSNYLNSQLLSYLIPEKQIYGFLLTHPLPFWNYKLESQQYQQLAQSYLAQHSHMPPSTFQHIITFSSPQFKQTLFSQPQSWIYASWSEDFLNLCSNPHTALLKSVGQFTQQGDHKKTEDSLKQFSRQWSLYLSLKEGKTDTSCVKTLSQLLCYPLKADDKFRKVCKFPQDVSQYFASLCLQHLQITKQCPMQFTSDTIYQSGFLANLLNSQAGGDQMDKYWQDAIDMLLDSNSVVKGLLQIEPAQEQGQIKGAAQ